MSKHSAMTEKQNKLNKLAMTESVYRKNTDSMLAIKYGEQIRHYDKGTNDAYRRTNNTINWENTAHIKNCECMRAIEKRLPPARYFVSTYNNGQCYVCNIRFLHDNFTLHVEKSTNTYTCTLTCACSEKKYVTSKSDTFAVIKFCEQITRIWDYEMFDEIAE